MSELEQERSDNDRIWAGAEEALARCTHPSARHYWQRIISQCKRKDAELIKRAAHAKSVQA